MSREGGTNGYRDLLVWQRSMDLVVMVYEETASWPREELYGLTRQVREAIVSVPSNIAEGYGRKAPRDFARFVSIAYGSLLEVETEMIAAGRLVFGSNAPQREILALTSEVGKMLNGFRASLERQI